MRDGAKVRGSSRARVIYRLDVGYVALARSNVHFEHFDSDDELPRIRC